MMQEMNRLKGSLKLALVSSLALVMLMSTLLVRAELQTYYVITDHLGTPQVLTDEAQAVVWQSGATPFGEEPNPIEQQSLRFPGQYYDAESGLYYNYYRDYDPSLGRYIQSDPIGLQGGLNTYGYVYQNPIKYRDPHGLWANVATRVGFGAGRIFAPEATRRVALVAFGDGVLACVMTGYCSEDVSDPSEGASCPDLPDDLVGDQSDPRAGPNRGGRRHTSGPLLPEYGGTGDFESDLEALAGPVRPAQPGDSAPLGSLVGENGVFGRPENTSGGASIDIPASGGKPHETLHY